LSARPPHIDAATSFDKESIDPAGQALYNGVSALTTEQEALSPYLSTQRISGID
jgi:hypothetical protein